MVGSLSDPWALPSRRPSGPKFQVRSASYLSPFTAVFAVPL
jgi:hypothetical protein